jgi:hypothetical protein
MFVAVDIWSWSKLASERNEPWEGREEVGWGESGNSKWGSAMTNSAQANIKCGQVME